MLQGTASSVGKSLLATALCRILRQDGVRVAPFKAQNMSNNSFVTAGGLELGRAQAVQAEAAGIEPTADMNPILLKPEADHRSQVVILGRPEGTIGGGDFISRKRGFWPVVTRSLDRLREEYDVIVIEGAGSPAEINLRAGDIANMNVARYAASPVLLVGDIDRGGVFAHLVGTLQLLEPDERALVAGLVINKFRGTASLLQPGVEWLSAYTGLPVAGVVPWMRDVGVADEDAVALDNRRPAGDRAALDIAVVHLPHIANFDDADALAAERDVRVRFISAAAGVTGADLIILPGTKSTMADLDWLRSTGIDAAIIAHAAAGGAVIGVCGGFQMLGDRLLDPDGVESPRPEAAGLGLLRAVTTFESQKSTHRAVASVTACRGILAGLGGAALAGYEIHMGRTVTQAPAFSILSRSGAACDEPDGGMNPAGTVFGTYLHALFDNDAFRAGLLATLAAKKGISRPAAGTAWSREQAYDRLAAHVRAALDMAFIHRLLER
jgi:adenosylcobyric acid synthase